MSRGPSSFTYRQVFNLLEIKLSKGASKIRILQRYNHLLIKSFSHQISTFPGLTNPIEHDRSQRKYVPFGYRKRSYGMTAFSCIFLKKTTGLKSVTSGPAFSGPGCYIGMYLHTHSLSSIITRPGALLFIGCLPIM